MKTVLHVIPSLTGGGAERQLALLAAEQGRRGWNVHVALRRGGNYARHLEGTGVQIHQLGDLRRGHPLLFARLHRLARRLEPDVLQTWLLQMDLVGGVVALGNRIPWVLTERCSQENYAEFPAAAWMRCQLGRHANAIVANSNAGARYWKPMLGAGAKLATIGNAIDLDGIQRAERAELDKPHLLCVGRFVPQKAHDVVLNAIARVPANLDFRVLVLGEGPLQSELEHAIVELHLSERVRLMPYQDDWWGLLKGAAGLLNPSRFEGQPNVVLEAIAASCPLVVSDIAPHRELLDDRSALFVPKDDDAALARAITSLLTERDDAVVRAQAAAARIAASNVSAAADRYEALYTELTGELS